MLALYDMSARTKISADTFAYGLGAALLQQQDDDKWHPVAFDSHSMNETKLEGGIGSDMGIREVFRICS